MSVLSDNKRRISNGRQAFNAYCELRKLPPIERKQDYTATDLIVDLCHFVRSKGWDTETLLRDAAGHLEAETIEKCAFCGKLITHEWAERDDDTGTIYYCSDSCKDSHDPWIGKRISTLRADVNEVEGRGEVNIPVGWKATVKSVGHWDKAERQIYYIVNWDDDPDAPGGEGNMGWCVWSAAELAKDATIVK